MGKPASADEYACPYFECEQAKYDEFSDQLDIVTVDADVLNGGYVVSNTCGNI